MPALSRTSLASLVCPSAPFLAPRLLRTYAPRAALPSPCLLRAPGRRYKSRFEPRIRIRNNEDLEDGIRARMRRATTNRDVAALMELYPSIVETKVLNRDDTRRIAQLLHTCVRTPRGFKVTPRDAVSFVRQVIQGLRAGTVPPHPFAFVHFLGIYKELQLYEEGHALWQWLVQQDDQYVSQAVYGAAIELLVASQKAGLSELEGLYADALKRFPGVFAEYHLSPDAIVPDRRQPTVIADLPVTLLQGILTARVVNKHLQKAYLALDTGLRLYPANLPSRFFEVFLNNAGGIGQNYTTFLVACRAGIVVKPAMFTKLIQAIRNAQAGDNTLQGRMTYTRAIANAIYAYLQAGGSLESIHVGQLLSSFGTLLPTPLPGKDYEGHLALLRNSVVTFAHGVLASLLQAGMPPFPESFMALVRIAGTLRVPDLLRVSLQDIENAHIDTSAIDMRSILTAAGHTGAKEIIARYWTRIAHSWESQGSQIDRKDWLSLKRACLEADYVDFFRTQLSEYEHAIPSKDKEGITNIPEGTTRSNVWDGTWAKNGKVSENEPLIDTELFPMDAFEAELAELDKQIKNISAIVMSGQTLNMRKTPFYMSLNPERPPIGKLEDLKTVYDEYTTDPHQPPPTDALATAAVSSTDIPLDELRFLNWVSIIELMDQAKCYQEDRERRNRGEEVAPRNPLQSDRTAPFRSAHHLRERIKLLREISVRKTVTSTSPSKLIETRHPDQPTNISKIEHGYWRSIGHDDNRVFTKVQRPDIPTRIQQIRLDGDEVHIPKKPAKVPSIFDQLFLGAAAHFEPPKIRQIKHTDDAHFPEIRQREPRVYTPQRKPAVRPLKLTYQVKGSKVDTWRPNISPTAKVPEPQIAARPFIQEGRLTRHPISLDESVSEEAREEVQLRVFSREERERGRMDDTVEAPKLKYYVSMKSTHAQPQPKPSFRPLGKKKSEKHHLFRNRPQEPEDELEAKEEEYAERSADALEAWDADRAEREPDAMERFHAARKGKRLDALRGWGSPSASNVTDRPTDALD